MAMLAPCLSRLFVEIDQRWPRRDRRTDGWYASPTVRKSVGHNPGRGGYTHAIDVDRDGIDPQWIVNNIYRHGSVLFYIIWNRTIWSNTYGWSPKYYSGVNPHTDHMHIEIYQTTHAEFYAGPWNIKPGSLPFAPDPAPYTGTVTGPDTRDQSGLVNGLAQRFAVARDRYRAGASWQRNIRR